MLKAGFYEKEITPPLGYNMPGYFGHRYAEGVRDRLFAKAAVFELGGKVVITIVMDAVLTEDLICNAVYERIEKYINVPKENVLISATHTHMGLPNSQIENQAEDYKEYYHILSCLVADTAILAYQRMVPVTAKWGKSIEKGLTFNRNYIMKDGSIRTNPGVGNPDIVKHFGEIDEEFSTIFFFDENEKPIGVLSNFALHHDSIGGGWPGGWRYSADYSGLMAKNMKEKFGDEFISVFISGACGNLNHIDVNRKDVILPHPRYLDIAKQLTEAMLNHFENAEPLQISAIDSIKEYVPVKVQKPTEEEAKEAEYLIKNVPKGELVVDIGKPDSIEYKRANAEGVLEKYNMSDYMDVPVQTIRLGDAIIFALIGEVYTEFGLKLKENSPAKLTMVSTLSNGTFSEYIPVAEAFGTTIYEAQPAASMFVAEGGDTMVDAALKQAEKIMK